MLRIISHNLIILALLFSQLVNSLQVLNYELNYDYYSRVLCENKDRPELHCEGKCVLAQQLALTEEQHREPEAPEMLPLLALFHLKPSYLLSVLPALVIRQDFYLNWQLVLPLPPYLAGRGQPPQL